MSRIFGIEVEIHCDKKEKIVMGFKEIIFSVSAALLLLGCEGYGDECGMEVSRNAFLPVAVDWSESGLDPELSSHSEAGSVHRLSLRFYPEGGGEVIVRFLEENLYYDKIEVPVGRYSVVAINEGVNDTYWRGSVRFLGAEDYDLFAAELEVTDGVEAAEPKALASWALGAFEVTQNMAAFSWGGRVENDMQQLSELSEYEKRQMVALLDVYMVALTRRLRVEVTAENLGSAKSLSASLSGLSKRISIVTREREDDPITHTFALPNFEYEEPVTRSESDYSRDGVAWGECRTFGHAEESQVRSESGYSMDLDVAMLDGTKHEEDTSDIDVGDQITSTESGEDYLVEHSLSLPEVETGDIGVDGWESGEDIYLN